VERKFLGFSFTLREAKRRIRPAIVGSAEVARAYKPERGYQYGANGEGNWPATCVVEGVLGFCEDTLSAGKSDQWTAAKLRIRDLEAMEARTVRFPSCVPWGARTWLPKTAGSAHDHGASQQPS